MNDLQRTLMQVVYTNKAFMRNPVSAFFTIVFPLMFLVIFSVLFGNGNIEVGPGVTVSVATFYVPAIGAFSVITACYTNIAISLSFWPVMSMSVAALGSRAKRSSAAPA